MLNGTQHTYCYARKYSRLSQCCLATALRPVNPQRLIYAYMQEKGKSVDHDSLLVPTGSADIFFPTNFEAATQLWMSFRRADIASSQPYGFRASVQPSAVFMNTYGNTRKTKTMTAYNPLLDDFENTSFILADTCCKT